MERVNIVATELIKLIPKFNGDYRQLNLFIKKCDFVLTHYRGDEEQELCNLHVITSRLNGDAAALVSERDDIINWEQLKIVLSQHFGDPRSEECIAIKLETLKMKTGERYLHFCNRIQTVRNNLFAKLKLIDDLSIREGKIKIYNNMSLNVFLYNLPEDMIRITRLKEPQSLEEALEIVLEEENFHKQYNMRNKSSQQGNKKPNNYYQGNQNKKVQPNLPQLNQNHTRPSYQARPNYQNQTQFKPSFQQRPYYQNNQNRPSHQNQKPFTFYPKQYQNFTTRNNYQNPQPSTSGLGQTIKREPSEAPVNHLNNMDTPDESLNFHIQASTSTQT